MRFSTTSVALTLFGAAASASASTLVARQNDYPACAIPCTVNADLNGCAPTDNHCLCTNQVFVSSTTACVKAACTGQDLQNALTFSQQLCLKVGVTLTDSAPASTPSSTATDSASASSTPTAPATSAPTTSAPSTATGASAGASVASPAPTSGAISTGANALVGMVVAAVVALAL